MILYEAMFLRVNINLEFVLVWFLASPKSVAYDYEITQAIVVKEEVQTCLVCEQESRRHRYVGLRVRRVDL